jgi:hypothetical protein
LAPNSGTESEILNRRTYQFAEIWQFYKYGWLMRISEIFLLENLSINVLFDCPGQVKCVFMQVKMILWYVQFLKSKMINIELFSVGSQDEFYLNITSYVLCILRHFVLFCWLRNSPFSNKDCVIYISQSRMPNLAAALHQHHIYFRRPMKS